MISVEKAIHLVLKNVSPLLPIEVPVENALGRVSAKTVKAPFDLPRFTSSAMDGFALRNADTLAASLRKPVELTLRAKTIFAGQRSSRKLEPKTAVRIMTGAPLPRGANSVLPHEEAKVQNGKLILQLPAAAGGNVRPAAEDCQKGERILRPGTFIDPMAIGFLSALGIKRIAIHRPPQVAIIITGNEIRPIDAGRLPDDAVYDTHGNFLKAALREFGLTPVSITYVRDRFDSLQSTLKRALQRVDLVLVTGGVSVGERDFVRPVAKSLGVKTIFWGVAQKPGKPLFWGRKDDRFIFGLPGNPAAAVVCYLEYVRPTMLKMLGFSEYLSEEFSARLIRPAKSHNSCTLFLRGNVFAQKGEKRVAVRGKQGSHLLSSFVGSNCLAIVPKNSHNKSYKQLVKVHPYPWRNV
jgi:molybdopterin molybdotransferase